MPRRGILADGLPAGSAVDARDKTGDTPLIRAARFGAIDVMRALLRAGADVRLWNLAGQTAFDAATAAHNRACARELSSPEDAVLAQALHAQDMVEFQRLICQ